MPAETDVESDMARGNMSMYGVSMFVGRYSNIAKRDGEGMTKGSGGKWGRRGERLMVGSTELKGCSESVRYLVPKGWVNTDCGRGEMGKMAEEWR